MDNIIECNELNYKYQNKVLFQDLTLEIKKGAFVTLIGKRGSGKTTLMKLIAGMLRSNHNIKVAGLYVKEENLLSLHAKIGFVFENPEKNIVANIVRDDILYSVPKGKYSKKSLDLKFQEVINILEIEHFLDKRTSQ